MVRFNSLKVKLIRVITLTSNQYQTGLFTWAGIVLLCWHLSTSATTLLEMDIDTIAANAELVVEAEVVAIEIVMEGAGNIVSYVSFDILDVIKGDYSDPTLELRFLGGRLDGRVQEVSGSRLPRIGEHGIYFVESTSRRLINPLLGWTQGHFLVQQDNSGVMRVTTPEQIPVSDIQPLNRVPLLIRKPLSIIHDDYDTAAGVITRDEPGSLEQALEARDFKLRIQELLQMPTDNR